MTITYTDGNNRTRTATNCKPHRIPGFWEGVRDDGVNVRFHRDQIKTTAMPKKGDK